MAYITIHTSTVAALLVQLILGIPSSSVVQYQQPGFKDSSSVGQYNQPGFKDYIDKEKNIEKFGLPQTPGLNPFPDTYSFMVTTKILRSYECMWDTACDNAESESYAGATVRCCAKEDKLHHFLYDNCACEGRELYINGRLMTPAEQEKFESAYDHYQEEISTAGQNYLQALLKYNEKYVQEMSKLNQNFQMLNIQQNTQQQISQPKQVFEKQFSKSQENHLQEMSKLRQNFEQDKTILKKEMLGQMKLIFPGMESDIVRSTAFLPDLDGTNTLYF